MASQAGKSAVHVRTLSRVLKIQSVSVYKQML